LDAVADAIDVHTGTGDCGKGVQSRVTGISVGVMDGVGVNDAGTMAGKLLGVDDGGSAVNLGIGCVAMAIQVVVLLCRWGEFWPNCGHVGSLSVIANCCLSASVKSR
jgi:hypothetical protein